MHSAEEGPLHSAQVGTLEEPAEMQARAPAASDPLLTGHAPVL